MVILRSKHTSERAFLMVDLIVAMAILTLAIIPLGYSYSNERRLVRATYQRAIAMELVDGEMEILAGGEWQSFPEGTNDYPVKAGAAANLPPGRFELVRTGKHLRLQWAADKKSGIGVIAREVTIP